MQCAQHNTTTMTHRKPSRSPARQDRPERPRVERYSKATCGRSRSPPDSTLAHACSGTAPPRRRGQGDRQASAGTKRGVHRYSQLKSGLKCGRNGRRDFGRLSGEPMLAAATGPPPERFTHLPLPPRPRPAGRALPATGSPLRPPFSAQLAGAAGLPRPRPFASPPPLPGFAIPPAATGPPALGQFLGSTLRVALGTVAPRSVHHFLKNWHSSAVWQNILQFRQKST